MEKTNYWASLSNNERKFTVQFGKFTNDIIRNKSNSNSTLFKFAVASQYSNPGNEIYILGFNLGTDFGKTFELDTYLISEYEEAVQILARKKIRINLRPALNKVNVFPNTPHILPEDWYKNFTLFMKISLPINFENLPNVLIRKIALSLKLKDVLNNCKVSKKFNAAICNDERFWNERMRNDYPNQKIKLGSSWKSTYSRLTRRRLYTFGANNEGQLGLGDYKNRFIPTLVKLDHKAKKFDKIEMVACGSRHMAVINKGRLYTFGHNTNGQLGMGQQSRLGHFTTPNLIQYDSLGNYLENVSYVSCKDLFTTIIVNGIVYGFGDNKPGQLGRIILFHGITGDVLLPEKIPELVDDVSSVVCGNDYIIVVSKEKMYALGNHKLSPKVFYPEFNVSSVAIGYKHIALISNGKLYTFGSNAFGQLGLGLSIFEHVRHPTLVESLHDVRMVACGLNNTAVIAGEQLFTFGYNVFGQLGIGDNDQNHIVPMLVEIMNNDARPIVPTFVACGNNHTAIIAGNKLYTCGRNNMGQLGLGEGVGDQNIPMLVRELDDVSYVACGSETTAAIAN